MLDNGPIWPFFLLQDAIGLYLAVGAVVALGFITIGVATVDHAAKGAYAFRTLIIPGVVMLWPYIALRWWRAVARHDHPGRSDAA